LIWSVCGVNIEFYFDDGCNYIIRAPIILKHPIAFWIASTYRALNFTPTVDVYEWNLRVWLQ